MVNNYESKKKKLNATWKSPRNCKGLCFNDNNNSETVRKQVLSKIGVSEFRTSVTSNLTLGSPF